MGYKLRVVGSDQSMTSHSWVALNPMALDLVRRGYAVTIAEIGAPWYGLEIKAEGQQVNVTRFNHGDVTDRALLPLWPDAAEADINYQLERNLG